MTTEPVFAYPLTVTDAIDLSGICAGFVAVCDLHRDNPPLVDRIRALQAELGGWARDRYDELSPTERVAFGALADQAGAELRDWSPK